MRCWNPRNSGPQTLSSRVDVSGPIEMCWDTKFPGITECVLASWVTLSKEIVELILVCGLCFLWGCKGLRERGRLRLFGERVECGGEGWAMLLGGRAGTELGEGVV